jgi:hypothetical protein
MALVHENATIGTTPTPMFTVEKVNKYVAVSIQNNHSASIFVGDSSITTSATPATQGHTIATGATYQLWLHAGDTLYGISVAATAAGAVSILYSGV